MAKLNCIYSIRLDEDMREWLDNESVKQNRSIAEIIRHILSKYWRNQKGED